MLYSFDIKYNAGFPSGMLNATIIMNLPQAQLEEVKRNPFVIDILHHPFMSAGIEAVEGHCPNLLDNIQVYDMNMPNSAKEVICRYQEQDGHWNFKTFGFKIYADDPFGCWNIDKLDFICKCGYDVYERLYQSGRYVITPPLSNSFVNIAEGYYYQVELNATVEVVRIVDASNPQRAQAEMVGADELVSPIELNAFTLLRLLPIRLNDELLSMMGFVCRRGSLYDLIDVDYFEGVLSIQGNPKRHFFIRRDRVGYSLIVEDSNGGDGCCLHHCVFLHELQYLLRAEYNANISLSVQKLAEICRYLNSVMLGERIMSKLPELIDNLVAQSDGQMPFEEQKVEYVAQHFGISGELAHYYLMKMHLY